MYFSFYLIFYITAFHSIVESLMCQDYSKQRQPMKFYAIRHCQRSNKTTIALAKYRRVKRCADLALRRHGLAFNFSPSSRESVNLFLLKDKNNEGTYILVIHFSN